MNAYVDRKLFKILKLFSKLFKLFYVFFELNVIVGSPY